MALAFGSRASTGLFIPLLLVGDVFAVIYYNRHTQWKYILKFIPWMIAGILIGVYVGKDLPEQEFKWGMVIVIFLSLGLLLWLETPDIVYHPRRVKVTIAGRTKVTHPRRAKVDHF